jgi:glyceraldehyde 3-phosphate dehydrogenase
MTKVAINGMGRIGRAAFKILLDTPELELMAVNDIAPIDNIAYLIKYDSVHGVFNKQVDVDGNALKVNGNTIPFLNEKDPEQLPWKDLNVDYVIESTGLFTNQEDAEKHIKAGARQFVVHDPLLTI